MTRALGSRLGLLSLGLVAACDGGTAADGGVRRDSGVEDAATPSTPSVLSHAPATDAADVPPNASLRATFSEPMASDTLGPASFTLTMGDPAVLVPGSVVHAGSTAVFWPSAHLATGTAFTATVTTGARSVAGVPLPRDHVWTFTTGTTLAPGLPVDLGTAGNFGILAKSAISTVPSSAITGDVGISPAAATYLTGFSTIRDASNEFATSAQVTGRLYAADDAPPTPATMTAAIADMERAFTDAAGRAPDITELGAGNIDGMTLAPGVYAWGTGLSIVTGVTLAGSATDVWIFQIGQDLTLGSGARVVLTGGARPENVFWQVAGLVELGTTAHCAGIVLSQTAITLRTGASIDGRLLAQTAVDLDEGTVAEPSE